MGEAPVAASRSGALREPWMLRSSRHMAATLALGIALPCVLFAVAAVLASDDAARQEADARVTATATLAAEAVSARLDGTARYVEAIAARPSLAQAIAASDVERVRAALRALCDGHPDLERAFVTDTAGVERFDWPTDPTVIGRSFAHRDWYQGVHETGATYVSRIYERAATPRIRVVAVATPIRDPGGAASAYLVAQYPIARLGERLAGVVPPSSGSLALVDPDGSVASSDPRANGEPAAAGDDWVVATVPVHAGGWQVRVQQRVSDVLAPWRELTGTLAALGAVCMLAMAWVGFRALGSLRRNRAAVVELQSDKDLLVGTIVHDLRNPLTAAMGWIDLARSRPGGSAVATELAHAVAAVDEMQRMTTVLIDVVRFEDGQMPFEPTREDVAELVRRRTAAYGASASQRSLALSVEAPDSPLFARIDAGLLGRVVENLLTNALKHTPAGGTVTATAAPLGADRVRLSVRDTGEGIPADQIGRLFQKYGRVTGQRLGTAHDTGLGLVFCRMAAERHGGRIRAESTVGRGTEFIVELPAN